MSEGALPISGPSGSKLDDGGAPSRAPPSAYLYVPSFVELPKSASKSNSRIVRSHSGPPPLHRGRSPKLSPGSAPRPHFLVQLPKPIRIVEDGAEPWTLRCVCDERTGIGLLVQCEKCGNWQHAICVGLNERTTPEKYICELCGNRPIRCKCGSNLNYRVALIQCTQCGYFVHRRCAGLLFGPLPRGDFVCSFCGKSKFNFQRLRLPREFQFDRDVPVLFTQEKTENLPAQVLNGPFGDFVTSDIAEATLSARDFCEALYERFRPFFFVCHPLNQNPVSRKKRHSLFVAFLAGAECLCQTFFGMEQDIFVSVFDCLLIADIYKPATLIDAVQSGACDVSENTRFELMGLQNMFKLPQLPTAVTLESTDRGFVSSVDLKQDTFICVTEGFVADLEEFNYDDGVDGAFFQIADTRLVLDARAAPRSILHRLSRSMNGNVVLKLLEVGDQLLCGLFVGRAELTCHKSADEFVLKAGEPLRFGIDFIPSVLEDETKWIGWHCIEAEDHPSGGVRPSRDDRELQAAMRQIEGKRPKPKEKKKKDGGPKKPRGRKNLKKRLEFAGGESTLFDLFEADGPLDYLFIVTSDVEAFQAMAAVDGPKHAEAAAPASRRAGRVSHAQSAPAAPPPPPKPPPEIDLVDFDKNFEDLLLEDLKPLKFERVPIPDPVLAMRKLLALGDH